MRRGPASRCSRRSRARCRGSPAAPGVRRRGPAPRSSATSPSASARHSATSARPRDRGIGRSSGSRRGQRRRVGEEVGQPAVGPRDRLAVARRSAGRRRCGRRPRVTCWPSTARTAISLPSTWPGTRRPGVARDERPEHRVAGEARRRRRPGRSRRRAAGGRARPPAAVSRRSSRREGRRHERRLARLVVVVERRGGRCRCRAGRREGAGVPAVAGRLDARHGAQWRGTRAGRGRRTACGRPAACVTVPVDGCGLPRRPRSSVGESGVDLADRVVELPDAGEAGREGDVGELQVGGLDQHPRRLGPPGPGQGERAGAELGGEQPAEVARRVADPARPARRRPRGRRRRRRSAASRGRRRRRRRPTRGCRAWRRAGSACRRGSRPPGPRPRVGWNSTLRSAGRAGRARGPAVDAGGADRGVEDAVEPPVARAHRAVAGLAVEP